MPYAEEDEQILTQLAAEIHDLRFVAGMCGVKRDQMASLRLPGYQHEPAISAGLLHRALEHYADTLRTRYNDFERKLRMAMAAQDNLENPPDDAV